MGSPQEPAWLQAVSALVAASGHDPNEKPPQACDLAAYAESLRVVAMDFAPGMAIPVPRERLLALLEVVGAGLGNLATAGRAPDLRIPELAQRLGRRPSTVRQICAAGEFDMPTEGEGAYKNRGREWMVPEAAVVAYEGRQRAGGRRVVDNLSDWKKLKSPKPRRIRAA
jgi:hypothetical protein